MVLDADCGSRALEIAEHEAPIELVITDVLMPGMDGFQLAEQLTRSGQARRFLFLSGYFDVEDMMKRLRDFPAAEFLSKPFTISDLIKSVRRLLLPLESVTLDVRRPA